MWRLAQGRAISRLTGFDRKTIRKYLLKLEGPPVYGRRPTRPDKLDAFKPENPWKGFPFLK